jgi:tetratricopeptide (TPR) repeat protein
LVEVTIGDLASAERKLRAGYETFHDMGDRYYLGGITVMLAEAWYEQGRFTEAAQMTEEPSGETSPFYPRAVFVKAKLLARRGQFAAARRLADKAEAMVPPTASPLDQAMVHQARAEVERLAGAPGQAAIRLRAALKIYEDRRATALAEQARTALVGLAAQPGAGPA